MSCAGCFCCHWHLDERVARYLKYWTRTQGFGIWTHFSFATALLSECGEVASPSHVCATTCGGWLWQRENTAKGCSGSMCRDLNNVIIPRSSGFRHILSVGSYCSFIWENISGGFIVLFASALVFQCLDLFSCSGRLEYSKHGLISERKEGSEE